MNDEGVRILEKFYDMLQKMHFHKKAALIGMSYGGLFSWRWAAEHPETVGAMYLDAPVCSLSFAGDRDETNTNPTLIPFMQTEYKKHLAAYGVADVEGLRKHPKNPLNNYLPIAKAKIPTLVIRSGQDQSVLPETNIDIMEKLIKDAGGDIEILNRNLYGHIALGLLRIAVAVTAALRLGLLRVFDLLVSGVDLLHFLGGFCIAGITVRVVLFCQTAVGLLDLFVGSIPTDTQHLIRIVDQLCSPAFFRSFPKWVQTPL